MLLASNYLTFKIKRLPIGSLLILKNRLYRFKHSLLLDKVEVFLNEFCKTGYVVKVFTPDEFCTENAIRNLLSIACCPQFLEQVHNLNIVVRNDFCTVGTLATLIIGDNSCKTEYQTLWQFALSFEISLHSWQVASLELGECGLRMGC